MGNDHFRLRAVLLRPFIQSIDEAAGDAGALDDLIVSPTVIHIVLPE